MRLAALVSRGVVCLYAAYFANEDDRGEIRVVVTLKSLNPVSISEAFIFNLILMLASNPFNIKIRECAKQGFQ